MFLTALWYCFILIWTNSLLFYSLPAFSVWSKCPTRFVYFLFSCSTSFTAFLWAECLFSKGYLQVWDLPITDFWVTAQTSLFSVTPSHLPVNSRLMVAVLNKIYHSVVLSLSQLVKLKFTSVYSLIYVVKILKKIF